MPLVEIVKSERTNDEVVQWLRGKLEECGKSQSLLINLCQAFLLTEFKRQ